MLGAVRKATDAVKKYFTTTPVGGRGGWNVIWEAFSGAWQRNIEVRRETVLAFYAIFSCITLIASDMAKMRFKMMRKDGKVWNEIDMPTKLAVLNKPNSYQNAVQFRESWMNSKLARGNTYVFLDRNGAGDILEMHVLNPDLVLPLVTNDGQVFYQVGADNLTGIQSDMINIPARNIIHDRHNCLYHPLVGLSAIYACGVAGIQGLNIIKNGALFFENMSRPSGILVVPGSISTEDAATMKSRWEENYGASAAKRGIGGTAVLADGVKYESITVNAKDAEMVEQLRMTAEIACSAFHVPKHKAGVGDPPSYNNIEGLDLQYLSQCLQVHIESMEACLNEAFETSDVNAIELDLDMLLRMDTKTKMETLKNGVDGGIYTPNEARQRMDLAPLDGGNTVYLQQQDYPMSVLANRQPPDVAQPNAAPAGSAANDDTENEPEDQMRALQMAIQKELAA